MFEKTDINKFDRNNLSEKNCKRPKEVKLRERRGPLFGQPGLEKITETSLQTCFTVFWLVCFRLY